MLLVRREHFLATFQLYFLFHIYHNRATGPHANLFLDKLKSHSENHRYYDNPDCAVQVLIDACTSFHPPREHRSTGALLIFFCSRIVLQKMYEVLLQRSTGSKEHFKKIVLLLLCSYAPLEDEKMYKRLKTSDLRDQISSWQSNVLPSHLILTSLKSLVLKALARSSISSKELSWNCTPFFGQLIENADPCFVSSVAEINILHPIRSDLSDLSDKISIEGQKRVIQW